MSARGGNVTVTIGAAFAGSFKSVLREADRELKQFGKKATRSLKGADRAAGKLGKSVAGIERAAVGAHRAVGATVKELAGLKTVASHTRTAARDMRTLTAERRASTKAERAHTAMVVRGAKAQARTQAKAARRLQPVALSAPGSTVGLPPMVSRRTRSGIPAVGRRALPNASPWGAPPPRQPRGVAGRRTAGGGHGGGRRGGGHGGGHSNHDAQAIVGAGAAALSAHTVWDMLKSAGELNDLQVLMKLQGRNSKEIAQATQAAYRIAKDNPNISTVEALKLVIDVADVGDRDLDKAARLAPFIARSAKAVSLISDDATKGKLGEGQSRALGRVIEELGYGTRSDGEIKQLVDGITQGVISTRGIYNPRELLQTVQKSGGMARGWSKDFIGQVLPSISMALGGSGSGDALYMFQKLLTKGQGTRGSAQALMDMGLINAKDLQFAGGKFTGIRPDAMPDADLLRANPYEWFKKTIVPGALRARGITDVGAERTKFNTAHDGDADLAGLSADDKKAKLQDKFKVHLEDLITKGTDTFAKAKNTGKMIADFIAQMEQIDAAIAQAKKQPANALDIMFGENFTAQVDKVKESFHSLMTAMGGPEVGTAITAMDGIARTMGSLATAAAADPETTRKVMAAFGAITAGFAASGVMGLATTVAFSGGVVGLAIGAVAAGLAAWAALDWDSFSDSVTAMGDAVKKVGEVLSSINAFLGLDEDGKGTNAVGRMVSRYLGNNEESLSQGERDRMAGERDKAKAAYDATEGANAGFRGSKRSAAKADLDAKQSALDELDARRDLYGKRAERKKAREDAAFKAQTEVEKQRAIMDSKANAARLLQEHTAHADAETQENIDKFKPVPQVTAKKKSIRKGDATGKPKLPLDTVATTPAPGSAVAQGPALGVTVSQPVPGSQGAPIVPGATVSKVEVSSPVRLVTPVLITAQGIIAVHDAEMSGAMSGLAGTLSTIAGHTATLPSILAAVQANTAAIQGLKINVTVNGGAAAGSAGASRERQSFSD